MSFSFGFLFPSLILLPFFLSPFLFFSSSFADQRAKNPSEKTSLLRSKDGDFYLLIEL